MRKIATINNKNRKLSKVVSQSKIQKAPSKSALGVTGLRQYSGYIDEEPLSALKGSRGQKIYREMELNDVIGAILLMIEMIFRGVDWRIEKAEEYQNASEGEKEDAVEWMEGIFNDMASTWDEFMSECLSMLVYGWSYFEILFKRRNGYTNDEYTSSKFEDGKIGISDLSIRSQDSLGNWEIKNGRLLGMNQYTVDGFSAFIPYEKSLLFKTTSRKQSPEGLSVLRRAYRPWRYLCRIEDYEAVGIERELNGLPLMRLPMELLGSTKAEDEAAVEEYLKLVRDVRYNEQGGVIIPSDPFYDKEGRPSSLRKVDMELVASKGTRAIDADKAISRYEYSICRCILSEFLMLGSQSTGSYALSSDKKQIYYKALTGWLESIADVLNRRLIPLLWRVNGFPSETQPTSVPGKVREEDLDTLGTYIERVARAGAPLFPDEKLEANLRSRADLPEKDMDAMLPEYPGENRNQTNPEKPEEEIPIEEE